MKSSVTLNVVACPLTVWEVHCTCSHLVEALHCTCSHLVTESETVAPLRDKVKWIWWMTGWALRHWRSGWGKYGLFWVKTVKFTQNASSPSILDGFQFRLFCLIDLRTVHNSSSRICEIWIFEENTDFLGWKQWNSPKMLIYKISTSYCMCDQSMGGAFWWWSFFSGWLIPS